MVTLGGTRTPGSVSVSKTDIEKYKLDDENGLFLTDIYILEEVRGNGYAKKLINFIIDKYNNNTIYISVCERKLDDFYKKLGFIEYERVRYGFEDYIIYSNSSE